MITDLRDLGSHMNTIRSRRCGTMVMRCQDAKKVMERITHMPISRKYKNHAVAGKVYPKAMYASDVTPVPQKQAAA